MATKSDFIFRYRIRNWADYNRALVRRGSLTFWIDEQAIQGWRDVGTTRPRGGRPRVYADTAIESALVVKAVFHLSLRATQGFLKSLVGLMGVDLPVPNYTTISRRQGELVTCLETSAATVPRHVVIDPTGLKVFGAGEWTVRKHGMGRGRRRIWRKLHLGVDEETKEIIAVDLTTSGVHDGPNLVTVLDQVDDDVGQVPGDRAYDSGHRYEAILAQGAIPTIPLRKNARPSSAKDSPAYRLQRDSVLSAIRVEGRCQWRSSSGATRQSLAENAVSRFKALVGIKLSARVLDRQQVEAAVKCRVLNRMGSLGMPRSERVLQGLSAPRSGAATRARPNSGDSTTPGSSPRDAGEPAEAAGVRSLWLDGDRQGVPVSHELGRRGRFAEVLEHHRCGPERPDRVRDPLSHFLAGWRHLLEANRDQRADDWIQDEDRWLAKLSNEWRVRSASRTSPVRMGASAT